MAPSHSDRRLLALGHVVWPVVVAGGEDDDLCPGDHVDEAVLVVDPA
jgi:hypothetical protein